MAIGMVGAAAQEVVSPCPEVKIEQKPDYIIEHDDAYYHQNINYRNRGWDTVVDCNNHTLELSAEPYIPVQYFNGTYTVEQVPYNPADTSFHGGTLLPITSDDIFCGSVTNIPYPFYFFGIQKTGFVVGSNGMVTFDATAAGQGCPWSMSATQTLPWQRSGEHLNDAIFGIYEDTHPIPSHTNNAAPLYQGIWYGIQGQWPCRKIIANWNDVATYNASNNGPANHRCTYQIVCYEGSNIIEVHIKQRMLDVNNSWNGLRGIVGIVNATGQTQAIGPLGASNHYVAPNSPASFFPAGFNHTTSAHNNIAFRFTPQGRTDKSYQWYRIFDDGRAQDSVPLTQNPNDTNGYYTPMHDNMNLPDYDPEHPTLTKAYVSPTCPSKYVLRLSFKNANGDWYHLHDTIFVGVDTANDMQLKHPAEHDSSRRHDICQGNNATVSLVIPPTLSPKRKAWSVSRILNGESIELPMSMYNLDPSQDNLTLLPDPRNDTLPLNKIDSIRIQCFVEFTSGCNNYDTFLIRIFPNFDTVETEGICLGDKFHWHLNNQYYTQTTNAPTVTLQSEPGCDSVVHLHLTVFDVSLTIDTIIDCKPVTWINGKTYTTTNTATYLADTIVLKNKYDCDSVVRLDLSIYPLTAKISSDVDHFDMDHLDAVLTDISTGGDSRRWVFPTGPEQTAEVAYYTIPANLDEADIMLIAHSPYGCVDSTNIVLPLNKEFFWMPNVFTPDNPNGNNQFGSVSVGTLTQEMYIYNRFGEQVYFCSGVDCTWDGHDVNGNPCPQGAYVYIIRYTNIFEPKVTKVVKGAVTLIR